ncbi:ABC transporter permease subunit, partial [Rhizobium leguminosarum]|uniref:ABC transporter permease subunit n=1 Tax=Rhizobium leguminosarum TaxID=384 RepID=UPI003F9E7E41
AFQDSNPSAIFVIFITSIWPVIINTAVGVRNIPQDYRNVAEVLRLNQFEFFWKAASDSGSQASGGTVRSTWKIGSRPRIAQTDWP